MRPATAALCLLSCLVLAACATQNTAPQAFPGMGADFGLSTTNSCQADSPPVKVSNIPPGAQSVDLKMLDLDFGVDIGQSRFGIRTTANGMYFTNENGIIPGSDIVSQQGSIPAGAIKGYKPPCPSTGTRSYQVQVRALDARDQELARVTTTRTVSP